MKFLDEVEHEVGDKGSVGGVEFVEEEGERGPSVAPTSDEVKLSVAPHNLMKILLSVAPRGCRRKGESIEDLG